MPKLVALNEAPAAEHQVGFFYVRSHGAWHGDAAGAQRQRMRFIEGALALEAGGDRRFEQLGHGLQFIPGPGVVHTLPRIDQRHLRLDQLVGGGIDILRIRRALHAARGFVVDGTGHFQRPHIMRNLEHHRARAAVAREIEGTAQCRHDLLRHVDRLHVLGDMLEVQRTVEVRLHEQVAARISTGDHHHRHRFAVRLRHRAEGILDARPELAAEHADLVTRAHAADAIGHVHADALLAHDDRADVHLGRGFGERVQGIGQQHLDAFAPEDLRGDLGNVHSSVPGEYVKTRLGVQARGRASLHEHSRPFPLRCAGQAFFWALRHSRGDFPACALKARDSAASLP